MTSKPAETSASAHYPDASAPPPTYEQATGAAVYPQMPPAQTMSPLPPPPPIGFHPIVQPPVAGPHHPGHLPRHQPVHVIHNTILVQTPVGPHSTSTTCPHCTKSIRTFVSYDANARTHLFALILCLFCFPCCILPYCITACKDTNHYCPSCGNFIGTFNYNRY